MLLNFFINISFNFILLLLYCLIKIYALFLFIFTSSSFIHSSILYRVWLDVEVGIELWLRTEVEGLNFQRKKVNYLRNMGVVSKNCRRNKNCYLPHICLKKLHRLSISLGLICQNIGYANINENS